MNHLKVMALYNVFDPKDGAWSQTNAISLN